GESGSGKSMTALSLLRLVPDPGKVTGGQVLFRNQDLLQLSDEEIRDIRGRDIAMIFQDPQSSLNPVLQTGFQIAEAMLAHNMGVVAGLCTRVLVMYAGQIVEQGPVDQIFENPQHPYTWSLLKSIPRVDALRHERLRSIEGLAPDLLRPPAGCRFHPRCPFRVEKCLTDLPPLTEVK